MSIVNAKEIMIPAAKEGWAVGAFNVTDLQDWHTLAEFLLIGSAAGSVFAALTFAAAAVSLPMIADREVDMITACISSINAVLRNKTTMLLWGLLLAGLTALGFLTAGLGLVFLMPWLAYATWHAYRDTLDPAGWPPLD